MKAIYLPSTTPMRTEITENVVMAVMAATAATFTKSEMTSCFAMAVVGAGAGGVLSAMLSHVITGPGLDKLSSLKRMACNWIAGIAVGFFGSWNIQKGFLPDWPVELCAALGGFIGGLLAVSLFCILLPIAIDRLKIRALMRKEVREEGLIVKSPILPVEAPTRRITDGD